MTVIYTAYSQTDALTINSLLRASGIESILLDYHHSTLQSHLILSIGIRIGVPDDKDDEAIEIIEDYERKKRERPSYQHIPSKGVKGSCPQCGSDNIKIEEYPRKLPSLVLGFLFMLPFVVTRKVHRCQDCGTFWRIRNK